MSARVSYCDERVLSFQVVCADNCQCLCYAHCIALSWFAATCLCQDYDLRRSQINWCSEDAMIKNTWFFRPVLRLILVAHSSQEGISRNAVQMEGGEVEDGLEDVIVQRRALIQQAYLQLRGIHPLLPEQLRDFQVPHISAHLCLQKKTFAEMLNFRLTWWALPSMALMALMATTYWAVCQPVTGKPFLCWSPVCSCHRVKLS